MFDTKIILALLFAGAISLALIFNPLSATTKEDFWNIPARTWKVERVMAENTPSGPDFFQTPGFQGILSPRFSNVGYPPEMRTQLPDYGMFGVPADPLGGDFGGSFYAANSGPHYGINKCNATVVEGFDPNAVASAAATGCNVGSYSSMNVPGTDLQFQAERILMDPHNPAAYANGNYKQVVASLMPNNLIEDDQDAVIAAGSYLNADGEMKQPIIYDRYLYANRHSRLRSLGDPIRGDLPIVPNSGNWFVPSVHPNIDLQAGAINVMAGVNNETNHQLASLIYNSSGGGDSTIGGVDLMPMGGANAFSRMNMGNQNYAATVSAGSDVIMTSFP